MKKNETNDLIRLKHIYEAAQKAIQFVATREQKDLEDDEMLVLALTRLVEIIGEASTHISDNVRETMPDIPWKQMIGMRNRLIHGYYDIDNDVLWKTIQNNLPTLVESLAPYIENKE